MFFVGFLYFVIIDLTPPHICVHTYNLYCLNSSSVSMNSAAKSYPATMLSRSCNYFTKDIMEYVSSELPEKLSLDQWAHFDEKNTFLIAKGCF